MNPSPMELLAARSAYGADPRPNHERIAALWSAVLGVGVSAEQVALCMVLVKVSRLCESPGHTDSIDDLGGYAEVYRRLTGSDDGFSDAHTTAEETPGTPVRCRLGCGQSASCGGCDPDGVGGR